MNKLPADSPCRQVFFCLDGGVNGRMWASAPTMTHRDWMGFVGRGLASAVVNTGGENEASLLEGGGTVPAVTEGVFYPRERKNNKKPLPGWVAVFRYILPFD